MTRIHLSLATATLAAAVLSPSPAAVANDWSNAVDVCQGALPAADANLRKRPLAIANESEETAFVSCSLRAPLGQLDGGGVEVIQIMMLMTNRAETAQPVNCTLVDGVAPPFPSFAAVYVPKTIQIAAGGFAVGNWWNFETPSERLRLPNLSCALPPGVEINLVQMNTAPVEEE